MLWNVTWTRFFTKPVCWQNSVVIFEQSYLTHITSFLAYIWSVYRTLSQESIKIEFASIGLLQRQIFKSEWPKVNIGRLRDLTLKAAISMLFLILFSCLRCPERYGCQLFNALRITSFQPLELTLYTKHRLKVKSANYLQFTHFCIIHPKCLQNIKQRISRYFIYKTYAKYQANIGKSIE